MKLAILTSGAPIHAEAFARIIDKHSVHEARYQEWNKYTGWDTVDVRPYDGVVFFGVFGISSNWISMLKNAYPDKKIIAIWIGSDILRHISDPRLKRAFGSYEPVDLHLADHVGFLPELESLGIRAEHILIGTEKVVGLAPAPMPKHPAAIIYSPKGREDFFRHEWYLEAARQYPEVKFHFVARYEKPEIPNTVFHGFIEDREKYLKLIRRCSMVLRCPRHDGIGVSYIEAMALGRWGINAQALPHSIHAPDLGSLLDGIAELREKSEPNLEGARYYLEKFSPEGSAGSFDRRIEEAFR